MIDETAAQIVAENLGLLQHPDGRPVSMAQFVTVGKPRQIVEKLTEQAQRIGTAIIHTLKANNVSTIGTADLEQLRATVAATTPGPTPATIRCRLCGHAIVELTIVDPANVMTDGVVFLQTMAAKTTACPHGTAS